MEKIPDHLVQRRHIHIFALFLGIFSANGNREVLISLQFIHV